MNNPTRLQRLLKWLITEQGKKCTFGVACTTGIGIATAYAVPNVFFVQKYKEIIHYYKNGWPLSVSQLLMNRFQKTLDLLQIPEEDKFRFDPFMVCGMSTFNTGTTHSKFGSIIGIPFNFTYESVDDIRKSEILLNGSTINWNESEANQLLDSLILSENAQLFAMGREIIEANSVKLLLDCAYALSAFVFSYGLGNTLNTKYNLYARPRSLRFSMYILVSTFGYGIYSVLKDTTQNYWDEQTDKELSEKSPLFVEGGKEYYEKIIQRNIALRKLKGWFGELEFTAHGNENHLFRHPHKPLVVRKEFFEQKLHPVV